ncbi:MAG TPA: tripartite tricarboxylate transporter permease [Christensenellaceae bacterium]|jgi:putative tricarboxylic transport membrane protein|nr:tripartite tricarboxylate transporter permease [Christensenellaceae bacterium]
MVEAFSSLYEGILIAITPENILYCFIGCMVGMLVGVLPGIGPSEATALLIPLSYGLDSVTAIIMLCGIYYGGMYGGTITSVLINTPGEAASVITCLDGYPLAMQGRAGVALKVAAVGSFVGGISSTFGLALLGPAVADFALSFGPSELFALLVFGMSTVIGLMGKSLIRGLIAVCIGLSLALVGMDPISGTIRYGFGIRELVSGLDVVTLSMGLFGLSEILVGMENLSVAGKATAINSSKLLPEEVRPTVMSIIRGSFLGFFMGLIPGTSSAVPALISYSMEKNLSKHPEKFGTGVPEGVAGPETANNSYVGGAMIPLFTLGIPCSPTIAILMGAFMMHGMTPGPTLFITNPDVIWGTIASMFVGNIILLILNLPLAGMWAKLADVPSKLLYPVVLIVAMMGAYTVDNSVFGIVVMLISGVIGYVLKKLDIPLAPTILVFVLADMMEQNLLQSLKINSGIGGLFKSTTALVLLIASVVVITFSLIAELKNKKSALLTHDE